MVNCGLQSYKFLNRNDKKMNKSVLFIAFLLTMNGMAKEVGRGGMAGSFLRMGIGARPMGMGGGSAALADDGYTVYYNPAGLVYLKDRWITSSIHQMALDRQLFYLGYASSIGSESESNPGLLKGGFGMGWLGSGVTNIDSRDANGVHQGMLSHNEHCFYFSFALNPNPKFAFGISGKILYNRFPGLAQDGSAFSSRGFGFDFGAVVRPVDFFTFGITLRDVRARYTWDSQKLYEQGIQVNDYFPKVLQTGIVYRSQSNKLVIHLDYKKVADVEGEVLFGGEYQVISRFCLRTGMDGADPTFGFGYCGRFLSADYQIDYAFVSDPIAPGNNHVMSCGFLF